MPGSVLIKLPVWSGGVYDYFDDAMRETRTRMMMMEWRVVRRDGNAVCADSGGAMGYGMLL